MYCIIKVNILRIFHTNILIGFRNLSTAGLGMYMEYILRFFLLNYRSLILPKGQMAVSQIKIDQLKNIDYLTLYIFFTHIYFHMI